MIRNDVAILLAEMLEEEYNTCGKFVELYFNGEYEGLYYLIQKVEISKSSVDLRKDEGVLFELDNLHSDTEICYTSYLGDCLVLKDIVKDEPENTELASRIFMERFDEFEEAAKKGDYEKVADLVEVESFAKYFLINEFAVNPDAYVSSFYLYKDGDDDKINAGPVWDFDFAFANHNWSWQIDERFFSSREMLIRKREAFGLEGLDEDSNISKLFYYLAEMPEFQDEVARVFREKMSGKKIRFEINIIKKINSIRMAAITNNKKWGLDDFDEEVERLIKWLLERYDFLEGLYGSSKVLKVL